jgi:hypothetical protein
MNLYGFEYSMIFLPYNIDRASETSLEFLATLFKLHSFDAHPRTSEFIKLDLSLQIKLSKKLEKAEKTVTLEFIKEGKK